MVNKPISGNGIAKKTILLPLLMILLSGGTFAQNLAKYYVSNIQPAGMLYFILPQTNFINPATKTDFKMDVTYLESKDSATVNFTYCDPESLTLLSVAVNYQGWTYQSPLKRIYIETNKERLWVYRYTFNIPFRQLEIFYKAKEPVITLTTGSKPVILQPVKRQWEKNSDISDRILQVIRKNEP